MSYVFTWNPVKSGAGWTLTSSPQLLPNPFFYYPASALEDFSEEQWNIASGEAHFLGHAAYPNGAYKNVNDNTYHFWEVLGNGPTTGELKWVSGLRGAELIDKDYSEFDVPGPNGVEYDMEAFYTTDPDLFAVKPSTLRVDPATTQELEAVRVVSERLSQTLFNFDEQEHTYSTGYGFDASYRNDIHVWHSGVDIVGNFEDEVYSPVHGKYVGDGGSGTTQYILILENATSNPGDEQRVWLIGHIIPNPNLKINDTVARLDKALEANDPAAIRAQIGTLANYSNGPHVHVEAIDLSCFQIDPVTGRYTLSPNLGYRPGEGWGQWNDWQNGHGGVEGLLAATDSPLQAFYEQNPRWALDQKPIQFNPLSFNLGGDPRGGGGTPLISGSSLTTVSVLSPDRASTGGQSEFSITVQNNSTATFHGEGQFFVIVSTDNVLSSDDRVMATGASSLPIGTGDALTGNITVDWRNQGLVGEYTVFVGFWHPDDTTRDDRFISREINIINTSFTDLELSWVSASADDLHVGDSLTVSARLSNSGSASSGTSTLHFEAWTGSQWQLIGSQTVSSLEGGTQRTVDWSVDLPSSIQGETIFRTRLANAADFSHENNLVTLDPIFIGEVDQSDPGGGSVTLPAGSGALLNHTQSGRIDALDDVDSVTFTAQANAVYEFGFVEPYLELRLYQVATGHRMWPTSDPETGVPLFQASDIGSYRVEIISNGSYTGSYDLSIRQRDPNTPVPYTENVDMFDAPTGITQAYDLLGGDDWFRGRTLNDSVYGGAGDDILEGKGGDDLLDGGEGVDNVWGGTGNDIIFGGDGSDYLTGDDGNDVIYGQAGNDMHIDGGMGRNSLFGGDGNDTFAVQSDELGENSIDGGSGRDRVWFSGFAGVDLVIDLQTGVVSGLPNVRLLSVEEIQSSNGNDSLTGSAEANWIQGGLGDDTIIGGLGDDSLYGTDGNDSVFGGGGNDSVSGGAGSDTLAGDSGDDRLIVRFDGDVVDGGSGVDTIVIALTRDAVLLDNHVNGVLHLREIATGGLLHVAGAEYFSFVDGTVDLAGLLGLPAVVAPISNGPVGTAEADWIVGGEGVDHLLGLEGDDLVYGGGGNDSLNGGAGNDRIDGGEGSDRVYFTGSLAANVKLSLTTAQNTGHGTDTILNVEHISSGSGNDRLTGNALGNGLSSGDGRDTLYGGSGTDTLNGGSGKDVLYGGKGEDSLNGGSGDDVLYGGLGVDRLAGGLGRDTFVFNTTLAGGKIDRITDYNVVDDTIRLDNAMFLGLTAGTLAASAFAANLTGAATDALNRVIYETGTGRLYFDADGSGSGERVHFATLSSSLALTNADFLVF